MIFWVFFDCTLLDKSSYTHEYKKTYGFMDSHNGKAFFINSGKIITENNISMLDVQQQNYLYSFADKKKLVLPSSLYCSDFIVTDTSIIVLSFDGSSIIQLDLSGNYVETIADFKHFDTEQAEWSVNSYITMDLDGNLYSTNRNGGTIYKVSKK